MKPEYNYEEFAEAVAQELKGRLKEIEIEFKSIDDKVPEVTDIMDIEKAIDEVIADFKAKTVKHKEESKEMFVRKIADIFEDALKELLKNKLMEQLINHFKKEMNKDDDDSSGSTDREDHPVS